MNEKVNKVLIQIKEEFKLSNFDLLLVDENQKLILIRWEENDKQIFREKILNEIRNKLFLMDINSSSASLNENTYVITFVNDRQTDQIIIVDTIIKNENGFFYSWIKKWQKVNPQTSKNYLKIRNEIIFKIKYFLGIIIYLLIKKIPTLKNYFKPRITKTTIYLDELDSFLVNIISRRYENIVKEFLIAEYDLPERKEIKKWTRKINLHRFNKKILMSIINSKTIFLSNEKIESWDFTLDFDESMMFEEKTDFDDFTNSNIAISSIFNQYNLFFDEYHEILNSIDSVNHVLEFSGQRERLNNLYSLKHKDKEILIKVLVQALSHVNQEYKENFRNAILTLEEILLKLLVNFSYEYSKHNLINTFDLSDSKSIREYYSKIVNILEISNNEIDLVSYPDYLLIILGNTFNFYRSAIFKMIEKSSNNFYKNVFEYENWSLIKELVKNEEKLNAFTSSKFDLVNKIQLYILSPNIKKELIAILERLNFSDIYKMIMSIKVSDMNKKIIDSDNKVLINILSTIEGIQNIFKKNYHLEISFFRNLVVHQESVFHSQKIKLVEYEHLIQELYIYLSESAKKVFLTNSPFQLSKMNTNDIKNSVSNGLNGFILFYKQKKFTLFQKNTLWPKIYSVIAILYNISQESLGYNIFDVFEIHNDYSKKDKQ